MSKPTRREVWYTKHEADFKAGAISGRDLDKMPTDKQLEFCKIELAKKYKKSIRFKCLHCASIALFADNGYVSDEELIQDTGLRHK